MISVIEPLPSLQRTVDLWIHALEDDPTRQRAEDARLALQADLWCEHVSNAPKAIAESPVDFSPLITPLPCAISGPAPLVGTPGSCCWLDRGSSCFEDSGSVGLQGCDLEGGLPRFRLVARHLGLCSLAKCAL